VRGNRTKQEIHNEANVGGLENIVEAAGSG